jgi:hypothetical protein
VKARIIGAVALVAILACSANAQERSAKALAERSSVADVTAAVQLDRTAMWVADRVRYTIEITCRRSMDILTDDLSRDKLKLEGLEVIGTDTSRQSLSDDTARYRFTYELTTYRVDMPALSVAPLTVRYYVHRSGQRLEDSPPAGDVQVPGAVIAFRSVLPDDQPSYGIRDARDPQKRAALFASLQPIGVGLILASVVPAGVLALAVVGRARTRTAHRSARQVRHAERESVDAIRGVDSTTEEGRREVFARVDALVREHLREVCGIAAHAMATPEVAPALAARGARVPGELVTSLLTVCEAAKFGPPTMRTTPEACREAIEQAEQVLAAGK